jgi:hypothetical protein
VNAIDKQRAVLAFGIADGIRNQSSQHRLTAKKANADGRARVSECQINYLGCGFAAREALCLFAATICAGKVAGVGEMECVLHAKQVL